MSDKWPPDEFLPSVEKWLEQDHLRPAGLDLCPEAYASDWFFPLQRMREARQMISLARSIEPKIVYEIGADKGASVYQWCKCLPSITGMIACEPKGTPYDQVLQRTFPSIDFLWLTASSYDKTTVASAKEWLDGSTIDILFIDGDKGAFDKDFDAHLPLMSSNGIVFMHDIVDGPMQTAFNRVGHRYRTQIIHDTTESVEANRRHLQREPVTTPYEGWLRFWNGRSCGVGVIYIGDRL